jgi:hypothetical protein
VGDEMLTTSNIVLRVCRYVLFAALVVKCSQSRFVGEPVGDTAVVVRWDGIGMTVQVCRVCMQALRVHREVHRNACE